MLPLDSCRGACKVASPPAGAFGSPCHSRRVSYGIPKHLVKPLRGKFGKILTGRRREPRMHAVSALAVAIDKAMGGRTIKQAAGDWGIPRWVLDDLRHGRIRMPGGDYLVRIAAALGMRVEEVIELAKDTPQ